MINKFQQGGQMNAEQEAFSAYLIKLFNPKNKEEFEDKVSQLSEGDMKELYKQYKSMESNQITVAKLGAKIDYLKTLRGECPEGYEVEKFMAGGCVKCRKKVESAAFKDKCGAKMKKRVKKNMGGEVKPTWSVPSNQKGGKADYKKMPVQDKIKADEKADSALVARAHPKSEVAKKFNKDNPPKKRVTKKN